MKNFNKLLIIILLNASLTTVVLSHNIKSDRYMIEVKQALKGDTYTGYKKAAELMGKMIALNSKHNLGLPIDFYLEYTKILLKTNDTDKGSKAFTAINYYITTTGKKDEYYNDALGLYNESLVYRLAKAQTANDIKKLLELGADVNARNSYMATPLHIAVVNKDLKSIKSLIKVGADVNAKESDGNTPLIDAALVGSSIAIFKVLIEAGADVNAKSADGKTVIYYFNNMPENSDSEREKINLWFKNPSLLS